MDKLHTGRVRDRTGTAALASSLAAIWDLHAILPFWFRSLPSADFCGCLFVFYSPGTGRGGMSTVLGFMLVSFLFLCSIKGFIFVFLFLLTHVFRDSCQV